MEADKTMNKEYAEKILVQSTGTYDYVNRAVEYARFEGFNSESAVFPVTSLTDGTEVPEAISSISDNYKIAEKPELPENYIAASDTAKPIMDFDWRNKRGLENLFTKGRILKDNNLDQLPDSMEVHLVVEDYKNTYLVAAACNIAFRLGMETTSYEGSLLAAEAGVGGNVIIFKTADSNEISYAEDGDSAVITIQGDGQALLDLVADFCMNFPLQGPFDTWADRLQEIGEGLMMNTLDGQLAHLETLKSDDKVTAYVDPDIEERGEELTASYPDVEFINYKQRKLEYERSYEFSWEVDDAKAIITDKLLPAIGKGDNVRVDVAVSEDKIVRADLRSFVEAAIAEKDAKADVSVLCSYKQGFSWIDEDVCEKVSALDDVKELEIQFKPFLKPGETEWVDENGATPTYNNLGTEPDHWYDLPIRYLQELYPIEDVIVDKCKIDKDSVLFKVYDGDEDITYSVIARDSNGNAVYEDSYKAAWAERPFLDQYPQMGLVHPATGYIRAYKDGELFFEERVVTDVEKIWDTYQGEVLRELREYVDDRTAGGNLVELQPFFSRIEIEVEASEPNEKLDSREDLISSLDGLHEDMYFVGTDFFKNYGMEKCGAMTDAPGLILPIIRKVSGQPSTMKIRVYSQEAECPTLAVGDDCITNKSAYDELNVWMRAIRKSDEKTVATIAVEGADEAVVEAYAKLLDSKTLDIADRLYGVDEVVFEAGNSYSARVERPAEIEKNLDIRDIDIMEDSLIGYEQGIEILKQLQHVPGIQVFRTTKSYTGRSLYAVEFEPKREGYVSRVKRITEYPSELINNRHHANEVAATNSAFMLIRTLLTDERFADLTEKMNLVIVPMENVDGTAIHYELQKDNPNWKFHVARFNALGKEFYSEHFVPHTIHTEALGLRRLFFTMLPDVIIDDHGVPSHEWEQQFSGYTSPSFKGFWLPRSLLYGYFFHIDGAEYQSNIDLCKEMEDVIANAFLKDEAVTEENLMWARQFEKYAHAWLPKMFPATYYKNMINYWIPHVYDPSHKYPSIKYPWIVSVDYVSEVADETAQGEYLNRCARAHHTHDVAIIEMVSSLRKLYEDSCSYSDEEIKAEHTRLRPLFV